MLSVLFSVVVSFFRGTWPFIIMGTPSCYEHILCSFQSSQGGYRRPSNADAFYWQPLGCSGEIRTCLSVKMWQHVSCSSFLANSGCQGNKSATATCLCLGS